MSYAIDSLMNDPAFAAVCAVTVIVFTQILTQFRRAPLPTQASLRNQDGWRVTGFLQLFPRVNSTLTAAGELMSPAKALLDFPTVLSLQVDVGKGGVAR